MTNESKKKSGTTRTYAERKAKGRPIVSVTLSNEAIQLLGELAEHHGLSRSAVVDLALRELAKRRRT